MGAGTAIDIPDRIVDLDVDVGSGLPPRAVLMYDDAVNKWTPLAGGSGNILIFDDLGGVADSGLGFNNVSQIGHTHDLGDGSLTGFGTAAAYDTGATNGTIPIFGANGSLAAEFFTDTGNTIAYLQTNTGGGKAWQLNNRIASNIPLTIAGAATQTAPLLVFDYTTDGPVISLTNPDTSHVLPWRIDRFAGAQGVTARNPNGYDNAIVIAGFRGWNGVSGAGGVGYNWGLHYEPAWDNGTDGLNFELHADYQDKDHPDVGIRPFSIYLTLLSDQTTFQASLNWHAETYIFNNTIDNRNWMTWTKNAGNTGLNMVLYNSSNLRHSQNNAFPLWGYKTDGTTAVGLIKLSAQNAVAVGYDTGGNDLAVHMLANCTFPTVAADAYITNAPASYTGSFFMGYVNGVNLMQFTSLGDARTRLCVVGGANGGLRVCGIGTANGQAAWAFGNQSHEVYAPSATTLMFYSWSLNRNVAQWSATGSMTIDVQGLAATSADGLVLYGGSASDATAAILATSGVPVQMSPRIRLHGAAWKSNATAASQSHDWIIENLPATGTAATTSLFKIGYSFESGVYTYPWTIDGTGLITTPSIVNKRVAADVTINSATQANVTGLFFAIGASEVWSVEFYLTVTGATNGIKFQITGPASPTNVLISTDANTTGVTANSVDSQTALSTPTQAYFTAAFTGTAIVRMSIANGVNAGTIQLQAATGSGTNNNTIKLGSAMVARRIS